MSGSSPLISVVIPVYNRENFIEEAIDSVLSQDYPDFELIVIDDGSTDKTPEVLKKYNDNIRYIHQDNMGVSAARNRGIKSALGEYIAFLDSDDYWLPGKLKAQIGYMIKNNFMVCHTDERWLRNGKVHNPKKKHKKYGGQCFEECLKMCFISPSTTIVHRSVFDEVGLFDEQMEICEDYDMWLRITSHPNANISSIGYFEQRLTVKRGGHEDQLSMKYWGMDRWRVRAIEKLLEQGNISRINNRIAVEEIIGKLEKLLTGYRKHGKENECVIYSNSLQKYKDRQLFFNQNL